MPRKMSATHRGRARKLEHTPLLKSDAHNELVTAVRTITKGGQYITAKLRGPESNG